MTLPLPTLQTHRAIQYRTWPLYNPHRAPVGSTHSPSHNSDIFVTHDKIVPVSSQWQHFRHKQYFFAMLYYFIFKDHPPPHSLLPRPLLLMDRK
uniref:Uncharacterized protein n=1 Tax=Anguilla anguilla TaxID=7936 RepID=A0A0E9WEH2_ANGAN